MKAYLFLQVGAVAYLLFAAWYLPEHVVQKYEQNTWIFLIVGGWTILPVLLMVYLTSWISAAQKKKKKASES